MQYLLYIDTSSDSGLVAISCDNKLSAYRINEESRNHAGTINNMISDLLVDTQISFGQLSGIVVCAGPGSYTGLRIGLATAKGLCYALDKPLILDNKLTLLAYDAHQLHPGYTQYISLLIAREKEYFISVYDKTMSCLLPSQHISEDQLNDLVDKKAGTYLVTNADEKLIDSLMINDLHVSREIKTPLNSWILSSFEKYNCNHFVNLMSAEPFYLKQVYTHK